MKNRTAIIEVTNLSFEVDDIKILDNLSFTVNAGEYLSIIGQNGAGKSTLLKCLLGINRSVGSIKIEGKKLSSIKQKERAKLIGYVPQFKGDAPPFEVYEFLLMSRYPYLSRFATFSMADYEAVDSCLKLLGLDKFVGRNISTLSGGEGQKLFLAAALVQDCQILLLDEPITFLDPCFQYEINRLLKKINREKKRTIISVSHDINSAVLNSDYILALKSGKVVCHEKVRTIINERWLSEVFDTEFIFAKHPRTDIPIVVPEHWG